MKIKVFYHKDCLLHNPPYEILGKERSYLERPERITNILESLTPHSDLFDLTDELEEQIDTRTWMLKVHSADYINYLATAYDTWISEGNDKTAVFPEAFPHACWLSKKPADIDGLPAVARAGLYCFDLSSPLTRDTWTSAAASLHVSLSSACHLLESGGSAFALCRPPGHHAAPSLCGGYCFINNAAVTARYLQAQGDPELGRGSSADHTLANKIAIIDIDYHHGNGTQQIFYNDSSVLYVSLHADHDYPYYTGNPSETGEGDGEGHNLNIPLPRLHTGNEEYCAALETAIWRIQQISPEYVIVSLGVDTYIDDPIGGFAVTTEGYYKIGQTLSRLGRPTLFILEGGYHMESIGANICNVLKGFHERSS